MKKKLWKKLTALGMAALMTVGLAACGGNASGDGGDSAANSSGKTDNANASAGSDSSSASGGNAGIAADSPYADKGFDLSNHETVVMYAIGEKPADMEKVMQVVNEQYMEPWLNTTLDVKFLSWGEMGDKYSLLLTPEGDQVDLMYTSSWCNYASEVANGGFKELDEEFLKTYLPYSYEQQAPVSWDQVSISGKIYTIPKNNATFNTYNVIAVRTDLLSKYNITEINDWDSMKNALITLAQNERENGIYANGQRGTNEFSDHLWWQNVQAEALASGFSFMYYTHGKDELPDWDKDVFYKFISDDTLKLYLEMAEMGKAGVWSPDRINDSTDAVDNFKSGKTASLIWNNSAPTAGNDMEAAGLGTYDIFDVTPNAKAMRGSYADDTVAITAKSKLPERAALVMDCLKGFPEVNNLVVGGIEGVHYVMKDGYRQDGPDVANYNWGVWAWGITGKDSPKAYNEDARLNKFAEICESKEYAPLTSAFTFDKTNVETELAVIDGIVGEYEQSFNLGLFGNDTEAKYNEMVQRLKDAGIDKVMDECRTQYEAFCAGMK